MLLGTYENQDEVQIELRNGVHKYQPIILAAGSIAAENRKSMKRRRYCVRLVSRIGSRAMSESLRPARFPVVQRPGRKVPFRRARCLRPSRRNQAKGSSMPLQRVWAMPGTRVEPETGRMIAWIIQRIILFIKQIEISLAERARPVLREIAQTCQATNTNVLQSRTRLSDLPARFRLSESQPRNKTLLGDRDQKPPLRSSGRRS
jgi:hypothetical protein